MSSSLPEQPSLFCRVCDVAYHKACMTIVSRMLPNLHNTWEFKGEGSEGRRVLLVGGEASARQCTGNLHVAMIMVMVMKCNSGFELSLSHTA